MSPVRLGQEFEVNGEFIPTKASVYLKRVGKNSINAWEIGTSTSAVIDATNFSNMSSVAEGVIDSSSSDNSIVMLDDEQDGFSGEGYMKVYDSSFPIADYKILNYPIFTFEPGTYDIWIRGMNLEEENPSAYQLDIDILLDGIVIEEISSLVDGSDWSWVKADFVLPDKNIHTLGIRMKEKNDAIDKIYIDVYGTVQPTGSGPSNSTSPYVTVHTKMYETNGLESPVDPLVVYDYKSTIDELKQDDWYNFNISVLDSGSGYVVKEDFSNNYFLIMSSSGRTYSNFISWEISDSDEYSILSSAISILPSFSSAPPFEEMNNIPTTTYYNALSEDSSGSGLEEGQWYINSNKNHALRIYSDFDAIEDV